MNKSPKTSKKVFWNGLTDFMNKQRKEVKMTDVDLLKGLLYGSGFTDEQIEEALTKTKKIAEKKGMIKKGGNNDTINKE